MRYRIEFGQSDANRIRAQKFRQRVFRESENGLDEDKFDKISDHCLIFDKNNDDKLVLVFRSRSFSSMKDILCSYSAQYYDLTKLTRLPLKPMEIGRLCVDKRTSDPFLLLTAFKYLASLISSDKSNFIFGCTSFSGANNPRHLASLSSLKKNQLARRKFLIAKKSNSILDIKDLISSDQQKMANNYLPPLLKFYLRLGGKVSDHAVIDTDLDTLHVFTYLDLSGTK
ncbi:GNAT family N-acetyltransferase [Paracoccaceae bacterium]|nr:GNAT family N-acetyltransferase [Paracoccaceae bacterium]